MLMNRSSTTPRILMAFLAAPLLMVTSIDATAAGKCANWEKKLKQEQFIIMEREKELTIKTKEDEEKFDQKELGRLIERHHASIETFNIKLDDFNRACGKATNSKTKPGAKKKLIATAKKPAVQKTAKSEQKTRTRNMAGTTSPEDVAASDKLITTLKGRYIQIGAFKRKVIAEANMKKLGRKGFESIMITRPYVYAIWVGPYESYKAAKTAKEKLLTELKFDGYLIRFK